MSFKSITSPLNNRGNNVTSGKVSGKSTQYQMNEIAAFQGFGVSVDVSGTYTKTTDGDYDVYTFTGPGSWQFKSSGVVNNIYVDGTGGGGGGGGSPNPGAPFGPAGSGGGGGSGGIGLAYVTGFQGATTWTITTGDPGAGGPPQPGAGSGRNGTAGGDTTVADPGTTLVSFGGGGGGIAGAFAPDPKPTNGGPGGAGGTVTIDPGWTSVSAFTGNTGGKGSDGTSPGGSGASPVWPSYTPVSLIPVPAPIISDTGGGGAGSPSPGTGTPGEPGHFLRIFYNRNDNNLNINEL